MADAAEPCAELVVETPFGARLRVRSDGEAIVASDFVRARLPPTRVVRDAVLREARAQLDAYLRKRLRAFDLPLHLEGRPFAVAVWRLVASLEVGQLISYGDVGHALGRPRAHRTVAAAMAQTPLDVFVPAHRVVGSDGTVRGADAGSMRRRLLVFEGFRFASRTSNRFK